MSATTITPASITPPGGVETRLGGVGLDGGARSAATAGVS